MNAITLFNTLTFDTTTVLYTFVFLFVVAAIIGLSVILNKSSTTSTPSNIQRITNIQLPLYESILASSYKSKTGIISQNIPENQKVLVNFAPLTVYQPGYIGPSLNGVYKEQEGVTGALKAGARCFVLAIDYHENSGLPKPAFPDAGEPCLLYRDEAGVIRSLNAGSIQKVAQALANIAFNDVISLKRDPLLVVLYFVRTPTPKTKEYLRFCSKVAKQLNPLIPSMLGQAPEGIYNRQAKQDELLYTALTNLERKTIVMSNIDTSIFRAPKSIGLQTVPITEDLDFMVHLRLYGQSENPLGATEKVGPNQMPRGYIERLSYYTMIPEKRMRDTLESNRIRWSITIPSEKGVDLKEMKLLLEKLGVQAIALNLYTLEKGLLDLWKTTGWIPKPLAARFTKPEPYKALAPSTKLNANKGQLSSPKI